MKQKYKDAKEIIEVIDRYRATITKTITSIDHMNHLADQLRGTCEAYRISGIRDDIQTMQREVEWREGRLETLKEMLAEELTLELPLNP